MPVLDRDERRVQVEHPVEGRTDPDRRRADRLGRRRVQVQRRVQPDDLLARSRIEHRRASATSTRRCGSSRARDAGRTAARSRATCTVSPSAIVTSGGPVRERRPTTRRRPRRSGRGARRAHRRAGGSARRPHRIARADRVAVRAASAPGRRGPSPRPSPPRRTPPARSHDHRGHPGPGERQDGRGRRGRPRRDLQPPQHGRRRGRPPRQQRPDPHQEQQQQRHRRRVPVEVRRRRPRPCRR